MHKTITMSKDPVADAATLKLLYPDSFFSEISKEFRSVTWHPDDSHKLTDFFVSLKQANDAQIFLELGEALSHLSNGEYRKEQARLTLPPYVEQSLIDHLCQPQTLEALTEITNTLPHHQELAEFISHFRAFQEQYQQLILATSQRKAMQESPIGPQPGTAPAA